MITLNLPRIAEVAANECVRQHVGLDRVAMLISGYDFMLRNMASDNRDWFFTPEVGVKQILLLAGIVDPVTEGRFRNTPVTFANGGYSAAPENVKRLMYQLVEHGSGLTPEEWTKEYLTIHPFVDGNGRTAWVLYNFLKGTLGENDLGSPLKLPIFFPGE